MNSQFNIRSVHRLMSPIAFGNQIPQTNNATYDSMTPEMINYIRNQDNGVKSTVGQFNQKRGSHLL